MHKFKMLLVSVLLTLILGIVAYSKCSFTSSRHKSPKTSTPSISGPKIVVPNEFTLISSYPHNMKTSRVKTIRHGVSGVSVGDSRLDVEKMIGAPDELKHLYAPNSPATQIGYTCWYVIKRDMKSGSVNQKNEDVIRLTYDFSNNLTSIDFWGNQATAIITSP